METADFSVTETATAIMRSDTVGSVVACMLVANLTDFADSTGHSQFTRTEVAKVIGGFLGKQSLTLTCKASWCAICV